MIQPPSLEHPPYQNRGDAISIFNGIFLGSGLIFVSLRIYVRTKINKAFGWDDSLIILALIFALISMGFSTASVHYGVEKHLVNIEPMHNVLALKWATIGRIPWVLSTMLIKLSICLFLYRIFGTNESSRRALYPIVFINIVPNIVAIPTILTQCSPVGKLWNPTIPGKCWAPNVQLDISIFQGAASAFCDFALAFLPIVFLWNIQIKKHIKVGICFLMSLGFFTGACAVVRTVLLPSERAEDITYTIVPLTIWAILEMGIGIILACVPTLRPLMHSGFFAHLWSRLSKSYSKKHHRRAGYDIQLDDRQRIFSNDDLPNLNNNYSPRLFNDQLSSKAYGAGRSVQGARVPAPVYYPKGISKTTEFEIVNSQTLPC